MVYFCLCGKKIFKKVILDTYVKEFKPPPEETRPSKRVLIMKKPKKKH